MISPILIAISPETPLSISSKNQVGSFEYCAKIAFTSMIRDISSDATLSLVSSFIMRNKN
jgi:hypothetical protein